MTVQEQLEQAMKDLAAVTKAMSEKSAAGDDGRVKELSDQLGQVQKDLADRKHQYAVATESLKVNDSEKKELERKRDELFIASALMVRKDGSLNRGAYEQLVKSGDYRDALKAGVGDDAPASSQVTGLTSQGTDANFGSDFLVEGFSTTLLEDIFLKLEIAGIFNRFNMPAAQYSFPFSYDQVTAQQVTEGLAPGKSRLSTGKLTFEAKKLMANIDFTDELDADSVIAILPLIRMRLIEGFALAQEKIAFNGDDTVGATNVNGAIGTGTAPTAESAERLQKGIRAHCGAGEKVDFSTGGFSADNLRSLRSKMGKYGKSPSDLAYIVRMTDYNEALKFTGYQSLYQYANAVTTTGELGKIDGIPVLVSELIPENLNAAGIYDNVTTTKTTCALVNKSALMWGDRSSFGLELYRNPFTQTTSLIGSQRLDLQKVTSPTAKPIALGYNYDA
jgi:HK97 family phage major capsid protein